VIIEGLLSTLRPDGGPHVAPMGPVVDEALESWLLRPFQSSTTFQLLRAHPRCIFHVVDDVLPIAQAALGFPVELTYTRHPAGGWIADAACHWLELEVLDWKLDAQRSEGRAVVVSRGFMRPFWGWNRAKHAVLEATILATRLHLADRDAILEDLARLSIVVEKTAGPRERLAWELVSDYIAKH